MVWGTFAQTLTAIATLATALGGLVVTFKVMLPNFRVNKETHVIVNQQRTDMQRYIKALQKTLAAHGIDAPDDQSQED